MSRVKGVAVWRLSSTAAPVATSGATALPAAVDTIVVGGGIIGASCGWQLARLGRRVLVLEQNTLTSGTTWHAAGLVTTVKGHEAMVAMALHSANTFRDVIEPTTGLSNIGWYRTGSLGLARSEAMWQQLQRATTLLKDYGIDHQLYGPGQDRPLADARHLHPLLALVEDGVIGALHTPDDGIVNPSDAAMHVVKLGRGAGARYVEHCGVAELLSKTLADGTLKVTGVVTSTGETVKCNELVLACGQWTRQLAAQAGVNVPVAIVPHQYVVFDRMVDEHNVGLVTNELPVVRDYERQIYIKPEVGGLMVGAFEGPHACMPPNVARRNAGSVAVPPDASHELYEGTTEKMDAGLAAAMNLVPRLAECGLKQFVHGPDTHSVDHEPVMGRAPRTDNLWIATGFNSQGIQTGPGVGLAMAEWIVHGDPGGTLSADFAELDIRRFHPEHTSDAAWCNSRALEGYAREYSVHYPGEEFSFDEAGRGVRLSPVHPEVAAAGAVFGSVGASGFERPLHFDVATAGSGGDGGEDSGLRYNTPEQLSFDARQASWWDAVAAEHHATRNGAALFDLSSFGKLLVTGAGAEAAMEWCASSTVGGPEAEGKVVYTQLLNKRGTVESDVTIVPLGVQPGDAHRSFYVVTGTSNCTRDADHIATAARRYGIADVEIDEVTDARAVLAIMGPESRAIVSAVFPGSDFSTAAFPFGTMAELNAGIRALRVSFAGELGWELHCPQHHAGSLWRKLHAAADELGANGGHGLVNAGYRALLNGLRIEKKYMHFGHDVGPADSPIEAGLGFVSAAKLRAGTPFLGERAVRRQKQAGIARRLVSFKLDDPDASVCWGSEGIYCGGVRVGRTTSGGIGHTVNRGGGIAQGYVTPPQLDGAAVGIKEIKQAIFENQGRYEIEVAGVRHSATVSWDALHDPTSESMRR